MVLTRFLKDQRGRFLLIRYDNSSLSSFNLFIDLNIDRLLQVGLYCFVHFDISLEIKRQDCNKDALCTFCFHDSINK